MVIIDWFPKTIVLLYFYIHEMISLVWLKSKTYYSEFHVLAIKLKITVHNDTDTKRNEYALTDLQRPIWPLIFQLTNQPVLTVKTSIDHWPGQYS